jgi:hypothetical protein
MTDYIDPITYDLTNKETKAAIALVSACLNAMGGTRPSDLQFDEHTWVELSDVMTAGFSRHQAAGLMSSLCAKGFISEYEKGEWIVNTHAWLWVDTIWDQHND